MNNPFIIAEIGINHNGDLEIAKDLVDMAVECGCDAVKFQKRTIDIVYSKEFLDQPRESPWGTTQREQKIGLEFGRKEYDEIDRYCKTKKITWFASAWDLRSLEFLVHFNIPYNKIASPMITNEEFVETVAKQGKHTFVSTGGTTFPWIHHILSYFYINKCPFTLMHSVMIYPVQDEMANVRIIESMKNIFHCPVGYSSHSRSYQDCILAVSLGAEVIEKHITLDRAMYGTDQAASLEEGGLRRLVRECRKVQGYMGDGIKRIIPEEEKNAKKLRYWEVPPD